MNYEFENESECIKHFTIKILTHHVYILYCIVFIVLFSILGTHTYTTFYFLRPPTCLKNSCNTCCYFLFSHYNVVNVPILQRFQQLRFHPSCHVCKICVTVSGVAVSYVPHANSTVHEPIETFSYSTGTFVIHRQSLHE